MIIALIIIAVVLSILAGFSKAICDLSEEGKLKFKNYECRIITYKLLIYDWIFERENYRYK